MIDQNYLLMFLSISLPNPRYAIFRLLFQNRKRTMSSSQGEMEPMYEVQKILSKRFTKNNPEYLIKWKGYAQKTWQPIQHLSNIPEMVVQFEEKQNSKRKLKMKSSQIFLENTIKDEEAQNKEAEKKEHISKVRSKQNKINDKICQRKSASSKQKPPKKEKEKNIIEPQFIHNVDSSTPFSSKNQRIVDDLNAASRPYESPAREGNVFYDIVKKVHQIKHVDGKWMAEVEFQSSRFQKAWVERDVIRVLYPYELLVLYEEIAKAKKYDLF